MSLRRTELLPYVFTNERGQYVYEDGSPIKWKPMDKPTERAPMLSDEEFTDVIGDAGSQSGLLVRDFYEAKITSGELRVVKKATNEHETNGIKVRTFYCSNCHTHTERVFKYAPPGGPRTVKFCPGCGAQIVNK